MNPYRVELFRLLVYRVTVTLINGRAYIHTYLCVHMCVGAHVYVCGCVLVHECACMCACVVQPTYIHANMHVCVHVWYIPT